MMLMLHVGDYTFIVKMQHQGATNTTWRMFKFTVFDSFEGRCTYTADI
jgi:hypothetical protein